jgi:lysophospholipase L1-like esterase
MRKADILLLFIILVEVFTIFIVLSIYKNYFNISSNSNNSYKKYFGIPPEVNHYFYLENKIHNFSHPLLATKDIKINNNYIRILKNNFTQLFDGYPQGLPKISEISINSDGFRDREFEVEKSNNTFRIVVLGDSVAFGYGININETFAKILEREINELITGQKFEVLNLAVPGHNTWQEVEFFKMKGLKYKPDIVIITYVGNDFENFTYQKLLENKHYNSTYLREIKDPKEKSKYLIDQSLLIASLVYKDSVLNRDRNFKTIVEDPLLELYNLSLIYKFQVIIVNIMGSSDYSAKKLVPLSKNFNWTYISAGDELARYPSEKITFYPVDGHLNEYGHRVVAEIILKELIKNFKINK